jgi:hypothetical protein
MVRRLPVINSNADAEPDRPGWHWYPIAAAATLLFWLPLAVLASWLGPRMTQLLVGVLARSGSAAEDSAPAWPAARALIHVSPWIVGFGVAAFVTGLLVGRFAPNAGARHAVAGTLGSVAVLLVLASTRIGGAWQIVLAAGSVLSLGGGLAAWAGVRLSRSRRR